MLVASPVRSREWLATRFALCVIGVVDEMVSGVVLLYHTLLDEGSLVFQLTCSVVVVVLVAVTLLIIGASVSGGGGKAFVMNEYSVDVAVFPASSPETTM